MTKMNFTPADDLVDEVWGKVGTPERDTMEAQLKEDVHAYFIGEAIKTVPQPGKKLGLKGLTFTKPLSMFVARFIRKTFD